MWRPRLDRHGGGTYASIDGAMPANGERAAAVTQLAAQLVIARMNSMAEINRLLGRVGFRCGRPARRDQNQPCDGNATILRCEKRVDVLDRKLDASSLSAAKNRDRSRDRRRCAN